MDFELFSPPPQKKIKLGGVQKKFVKNEKIKVVKNCLKWRENWLKTSFGLFNPLPPKKIGGVQQNFVEK